MLARAAAGVVHTGTSAVTAARHTKILLVFLLNALLHPFSRPEGSLSNVSGAPDIALVPHRAEKQAGPLEGGDRRSTALKGLKVP
jgi:hypothetical protein